MSTSRLITKKRRSNDDQEDNLIKQRLIRRINASSIIRPRKIPDLNLISRTRKPWAPDSRPEAENDDADRQLFQELKKGGWPDSESCMWLSSGSRRSSSRPSLLNDPTFGHLSNVDMSPWKRFLFVLMLLANSKPGFQEFQGNSYPKNDKCGSYEPLVNLEEESSDWGPITEPEVDFLQPNFPSMSYKRSTIVSNIQASNSRITGDVVETDHFPFDVDVDTKDDADEPLFWPSDLKSAWFSEPGSNIFAMSPAKKKRKEESPEKKVIDIIEEEKADLLEVEDVNLDEINADEPLVWPSDRVVDWSPEVAWNFFSMSPLKRRQHRDALMDFSVEEPLFWPSDSAFEWDQEAARNFFAMSPRRDKNVSFESSKARQVGVKAALKRNQGMGMGGVIISPRVLELRNGNGGSKGVVRTKSMSALRKCSSFANKEGIL